MKAIVVDDEPLAIDIVVTYLHNLNIRAINTANNAVEAFQQLQQQPVDLLFLDIQMPQLTGFDLLKACLTARWSSSPPLTATTP